MAIDLEDVKQLEKTLIQEYDRWLYCADFNIKYSKKGKTIKLKSTERIDAEIEDIKQISDKKGITIILAHQGRYKKGAEHLDFIAPYLGKKLDKEVKYFPENNTVKAIKFIKSLKPGDIAIMGNTRFHEGEEKNEVLLAEQFAKLVMGPDKKGFIAMGGFGKAHRENASNVGILQHLEGYASRSQIREMKLLEKWAGKKQGTYSVAVLGGVKKEKITEGLAGFSKTYDSIIPGGIVLNTIYFVQGKKIGRSLIEDNGKKYDKIVRDILESKNAKKICIPEEVIIAKPAGKGFEDAKKISIDDRVMEDYMIVDYVLPDSAVNSLKKLASQGGRMVLAGTPGIYIKGFKTATDGIFEYMVKDNVDAIMLGGDTAGELKFKGSKSTGGGSALSFVANGTTAVYQALKANKKKFC